MANQNRGERLPGEVLALADIRALLRACNQGATGARNRALLVSRRKRKRLHAALRSEGGSLTGRSRVASSLTSERKPGVHGPRSTRRS